jgi:hypothetical protein
MAKIAIVTGATGGLGQEFIKEIQKIDGIDTYEAYLKWCTKSKKLLKNC